MITTESLDGSIDEHVSNFKKLVEIAEVPDNDKYIFFMSLPGSRKPDTFPRCDYPRR